MFSEFLVSFCCQYATYTTKISCFVIQAGLKLTAHRHSAHNDNDNDNFANMRNKRAQEALQIRITNSIVKIMTK